MADDLEQAQQAMYKCEEAVRVKEAKPTQMAMNELMASLDSLSSCVGGVLSESIRHFSNSNVGICSEKESAPKPPHSEIMNGIGMATEAVRSIEKRIRELCQILE